MQPAKTINSYLEDHGLVHVACIDHDDQHNRWFTDSLVGITLASQCTQKGPSAAQVKQGDAAYTDVPNQTISALTTHGNTPLSVEGWEDEPGFGTIALDIGSFIRIQERHSSKLRHWATNPALEIISVADKIFAPEEASAEPLRSLQPQWLMATSS